MDSSILIYGANGYTGALVARRATARGLRPILAGRNAARLQPLADELGLSVRTVELTRDGLRAGLRDVGLVLNCAGPFALTAPPIVDACIEAGAHYLDISGEWAAIEAVAERGPAAAARGVALLPGVGFDAAMPDCLAGHAASLLPGAHLLRVGVQIAMTLSAGTAATAVGSMGDPSYVRRNGQLTPVPMGALTRSIDYGDGVRTSVAMPLADLATAHRSTGIADVEVYAPLPLGARLGLRLGNVLAPLLRLRFMRRVVSQLVRWVVPNPKPSALTGTSRVWVELTRSDCTLVARLEAGDHYILTAECAVEAARAVGALAPGFHTPFSALGADFPLRFESVRRSLEGPRATDHPANSLAAHPT